MFSSHTLPQEIKNKLHVDSKSLTKASKDFGNIICKTPAAVFHPTSVDEIALLIKYSYESAVPFHISVRGRGGSIWGQAMAENGVVIDMSCLRNDTSRIKIPNNLSSTDDQYFVDVGGEQLWKDVLFTTIEHGLAPLSWTDYLYLTIGGTLSVGGISGQTSRYGPQISQVLEMDVITGKGELVTCNKKLNAELFDSVLGGLGQFGVITRARIALDVAPTRVKLARLFYSDLSTFMNEQEKLISMGSVEYVGGFTYIHGIPPNETFYSSSDIPRLTSLVDQYGIVYCIELCKYYNDESGNIIDKEFSRLLNELNYIEGSIFIKDDSFVEFLFRNKIPDIGEDQIEMAPTTHPWLNIFLPKSRVMDFDAGVFRNMTLKQKDLILFYAMKRNKWDDKMSAVVPDEDIFYAVVFLNMSGINDLKYYLELNKDIMKFCEETGINAKQYMPHFETKYEWINYFGSKWEVFQARKTQFDPKTILTPGQGIFNCI